MGPLSNVLSETVAAWSPDPALVVPLVWVVLLYTLGLARVWRRAGIGRGVPLARGLSGVFGLASLAVAVASPLEALTGLLFSAHMAQHLLLVLVAAPLLAGAAPALTMLWALPGRVRRPLAIAWSKSGWARLWRLASHPLAATVVFVAVLWAWHLPSLYQAAARNDALHTLEHLSMVGSAMLFWWSVLAPLGRPRIPRLATALLLFFVAAQGGILGALMTLAPEPWYPFYVAAAASIGVPALRDQQLAGLLMWIPPGGLYLALTGWMLLRGLRDLDEEPRPTRPDGGSAPADTTSSVEPPDTAPLRWETSHESSRLH